MLLLVGVSGYRSARENGDRTVRCDVSQTDGPDELACCGEITPSTGRARHSAAERGSVQPAQCRYRHWTGFSSQGDGASFEGSYSHARGTAGTIRAHAPKDTTLHRIADALQAAQRRNFWQLTGSIRTRGNYCHEYSMAIGVERDSPTWQPMTDDAEDTVIEAMRDLARWLYRQLRQEYEHLTSDAAIDETVADNEWTFTAGGKRFG